MKFCLALVVACDLRVDRDPNDIRDLRAALEPTDSLLQWQLLDWRLHRSQFSLEVGILQIRRAYGVR